MAKRKKTKFWDIKNVLTTLKSSVVGIVAGLPLMIMVYLRGLVDPARTMLMAITGLIIVLYAIFNLWFWGYLAKSFWGWE